MMQDFHYPNFEDTHPHDILRWAAGAYGSCLAIVTSFQPTGIVTLDMMSKIAPDTTVITLDTGLLFPETYALIDEIEARFHLNLIRVRPLDTVEEQAARYGDHLWERDPNQCCGLRKVVPLKNVLTGYDAWITGLRRDQSSQRVNTPIVGWDTRHQRTKISPFAAWTDDMIWDYIHTHDLPYNALHDKGYPSIGCWPCTQAKAHDTGNNRAGRWANHEKTECGIHITATGELIRTKYLDTPQSPIRHCQ